MRRNPRTKAEEFSERRGAPRIDVGGAYCMRLDPGDGREPLECPVMDYSVTGVRLKVPNDVALPQDVQVLIGELSHNARIVWRKDGVIGVDFVDEHHSLYY
jgi:hypothetical protein